MIQTLAAYIIWGFLTLFWNLLEKVDSVYILTQRIVWSMVFMGILLAVGGYGKEAVRVLKNRRQLGTCLISGILVSVNWGAYIYAINSGHVLDASLGYFIEPLMVAVIGVLVFKERLNIYEKIAYGCSIAGLLYLAVAARTFPVLALIIAGSFAVYGAVKKELDISPMVSLFTETLCVTPAALIYIAVADMSHNGSVGVLTGAQYLLLPACGVVTSIPLLLFNRGVKEIPYYIAGMLMYVNPTIQFLMGLFYYQEALDINRLIAFIIIWAGIGAAVLGDIKLMKQDR